MTSAAAPLRPGMFSPKHPDLQIGWDATCMTSLLKCPRNYQLSILQGWRKNSVHLDFGRMVADGFETFQKARLRGATRHEAISQALANVMAASWNEDGSQWGGYWEDQWKCGGTVKYKNAKGNTAKCPYSHKKMWFPPDAPDVCGECGCEEIILARNYCPDHSTKHRVNLARVMIWYGLDQPENLADGLHPYTFPDGTPAVELSWRLPLPRKSPYDDDYLICGHFDYIGVLGGEMGPVDNKTTKNTLGKGYFSGFAPSVQFDTYDMAAPLLFPDLTFDWVAVDAVQIMVDTIRCGRAFFRKSHSQRVEHYDTIMEVLNRAELYATSGLWPQDKSSCAMCDFKDVCTLPVGERAEHLEANYMQNFWNPLENR